MEINENYKRKINNDSEENNNNKKIKNNINEIINKDYKDIRLLELKEYAKNIGVNNQGKKSEIYDRIKEYWKIKENTIKEIQEKESINSFNKYSKEFEIKDIEPLEKLFWKCFRNIIIYKTIFSNFQFKRSFNYERLHIVSYILRNFTNGKEIIKDKIKSNSHLSINVFDGLSWICKEFKKTKNKDINKENQIILKQLFEKYSKSIHQFNIIENSILNLNISILKLLNINKEIIEEYFKTNPDFSELNNSINLYQYFKISNYLLKFNINLKINFNNDLNIFNLKLKQFLKLLLNLPNILINKEIDINQIKNLNFTNQQLNLKIKKLLKNYSNLLFLNNGYNNNNNNNYNNNQNELKLNILKLIKFYFNYLNIENYSFEYFLYFGNQSEILENNNKNSNKEIIKFLKFNNLNIGLLLSLLNFDNLKIINENIKLIKKSNNSEFKNYLIKEFKSNLKKIIENEKFEIYSFYSIGLIDPILEFYLELYQNDIEKCKDLIIFKDKNKLCCLVSNLSLLEKYEFIMIKLNRKFLIDYNICKFYDGSIKEIKQEKREISFISILNRSITNSNCYLINSKNDYRNNCSFSRLLIKNYNNSNENYLTIKIFKSNKFENLEFRCYLPTMINKILIKWIVCNLIQSSFKLSIDKDQDIYKNLSINFIDNNNNNLIFEISKETILYFYYLCGEYEIILNQFNINNYSIYTNKTGLSFKNQYSIEFLNNLLNLLLFKIYNKNNNNNSLKIQLSNILIKIIQTNNFNLIQFFNIKYLNQLFVPKSSLSSNNNNNIKDGESIFYIKDLKLFLIESIKNDSFEITELLLNHFTTTKNIFKKFKFKFSIIEKYLLNKFK